MSNQVFIVGLPMSQLRGDPQLTLFGNTMRSWALFSLLGNYGFETRLHIKANAAIDEEVSAQYGDRIILGHQRFLEEIEAADNPFVVVCGTRIHETLKHYPWIADIRNARIVLAQCYHNVMDPLPDAFLAQIKAALFVTPKYINAWNKQYPNIPTSILTTGQVSRPPDATESTGEAVFVGHIHNVKFLALMGKLASNDPSRIYHVVSGRIKDPKTQEFIAMELQPADERQTVFRQLVMDASGEAPPNLHYHHLPPGQETELMDRVSIGIDYTWGKAWKLDNSKVPYYLSYGLNVIAHLPSPSHRFVSRFNAGKAIEQDAPWQEWLALINQYGELDIGTKNARRMEAGNIFSWRNVAFDVGSILLELQDS